MSRAAFFFFAIFLLGKRKIAPCGNNTLWQLKPLQPVKSVLYLIQVKKTGENAVFLFGLNK